MRAIYPASLLVALLFCRVPASAEIFTLKEAITVAIDSNPQLKAFERSVEAGREQAGIARGSLFPKITFEEKFMRTDNPTYGFMAKLNQERFTQNDFLIDQLNNPRDISDFQTSLHVEQALYAPRLLHGIDIASREMHARSVEYTMRKSELARNVVRNALAVHVAKEYVKVSRIALKDAEEHKRLAALRYETGMGLYSDMLRADAGIKNAEAMITRAESGLDIAQRSLGLLMGRSGPVDMAAERPVLPLNDVSIYLDASTRREDIQALDLRYRNSVQAVGMERSLFLPEIGIGGSYLMNDHRDPLSPEGESYIVTAYLRWNLFDAASYHRIKKAKAEEQEMKHRLSGLEQEIEFKVHEAFIRIREKEKTLDLTKASLEDAQEALRLVRTRYENALAPMVDLLDTQLMLDTARVNVIESENEYINAIVDLYYQSGMLLKALGVDVRGPL